jgi:Ca2+-binding EF-hand superfamily protein
MNLFLEDFLQDESNPMEMRRDVYQRFGSFTRALVSMFELTLGSWYAPVCLLQEVNDWWAVGCLVYICIVWFAVVQVIRGVFISETFKVAGSDHELMIKQKNRQIQEHTRNMEQFIMEADIDGDGFVSLEEFLDIVQDPRVKMWIAAMGVEIRDAEHVFDLLDNEGDKKLSAQEVVQGIAKLKGGATAVDIMMLNKRCDATHRACKRMERELIGLERLVSP